MTGSDSLCASHADGVLNLVGSSSNIIQWQSSTDNGATWTPTVNSTPTLIYIGLTMNTLFRAVVDGGFCPNFLSDTAIIIVDPVTSPGTIIGSDSLCILNATGALNLTGAIGSVSYWEFSTDSGATWNTIANTTTTENYTLTQTTWYRAYTDGGACPSYFSDTAIVYVEPALIPGTVQGSDTVCGVALNGTLTLSGASGTVAQWESSTDFGTTWTPIANMTTTYAYSNISTTTLFRVLTHGTFCADVYSDTVGIYVDLLSNAGTLNASQQLCMGDSFQLDLTGYTANAFQWETSADSIVWTPVAGATSYDYTITNAGASAFYYVIAQNVNCPPDTSNVVAVTVTPNPIADAGSDVTITLGDTTLLAGTGGLVGVWTPGITLSDSIIASPFAVPLVTTTYTYTVLDANGCMGHDSVTITVDPPTLFDIKNVITANGDGHNDSWIIQGIENFPSTFVIVFNIYGKEVYSSDDYKNDWKGTWKERKLPNGTYYYTVVQGGTESKLKGTLTILGDE
jgi:gliding motility-associated-like protein